MFQGLFGMLVASLVILFLVVRGGRAVGVSGEFMEFGGSLMRIVWHGSSYLPGLYAAHARGASGQSKSYALSRRARDAFGLQRAAAENDDAQHCETKEQESGGRRFWSGDHHTQTIVTISVERIGVFGAEFGPVRVTIVSAASEFQRRENIGSFITLGGVAHFAGKMRGDAKFALFEGVPRESLKGRALERDGITVSICNIGRELVGESWCASGKGNCQEEQTMSEFHVSSPGC
jgi:hypothetical protein